MIFLQSLRKYLCRFAVEGTEKRIQLRGILWRSAERKLLYCGKGTQCAKIVEAFGFTHLSAGELLRRNIYSNSKKGEMIRDTIKEGKIVPSDITVSLIKKGIKASENDKFLIDGFPRSEDNRVAFEHIIGAEPELVLFLECPEEEMIRRVLNRNQGRIDDNIETIEKRLKVFNKLNFPVINYYDAKGKLRKLHIFSSERRISSIIDQEMDVQGALQAI
ncbi:UMP-CMP kinase-like isoform X2 [Nymphaea colorata]|uniref:UMP-CMP kinase-like isoform X2 n=1 Tax=Nymphaea colorata TaxID=210225 RepID=UPI00214E0F4F|nr:UMP-CMP kinase-like isoform X2 [Nymphaea colorata]XP_049933263.1 UMP-CMP kinase-like isoform X2 [Nymphaea colorata]XP_049933264.1 UMP-CMP kinase-like isoform X2 [Nymphaea colorata]XP_049933265.1 UMP-CMP kinase-like isoform X2 [Nymphaea colorata]XP_049933266.1 UMP-CMP kinase-like isoform X2 [Nymphaea colorata]